MIAGVIVKTLKLLPNARGRLMEVQRKDDDEFIGFAQCYITETFPGIVKAWYRHQRQIDQIAVVSGLLKLALYDSREESPTYQEVMEIILGELAPKLVQIPPGIWHGFQAIGPQSAFLIHLNSEMFDPEDTDEERLPIDTPQIPYRWD